VAAVRVYGRSPPARRRRHGRAHRPTQRPSHVAERRRSSSWRLRASQHVCWKVTTGSAMASTSTQVGQSGARSWRPGQVPGSIRCRAPGSRRKLDRSPREPESTQVRELASEQGSVSERAQEPVTEWVRVRERERAQEREQERERERAQERVLDRAPRVAEGSGADRDSPGRQTPSARRGGHTAARPPARPRGRSSPRPVLRSRSRPSRPRSIRDA